MSCAEFNTVYWQIRLISGLPVSFFLLKQSPMKFASILFALVTTAFLVSCASSPEELQARMDRKEQRFNDRQEMWDIRAESFDKRLNKMSQNADYRYERSFAKTMAD